MTPRFDKGFVDADAQARLVVLTAAAAREKGTDIGTDIRTCTAFAGAQRDDGDGGWRVTLQPAEATLTKCARR